MFLCRVLVVLFVLAAVRLFGQTNGVPLADRPWFETRTAHFNIYSCGDWQQTYRLAGQLEQFRRAYALLAGEKATASPPIVVLAFPDHEAMLPFLPLYEGRPANIAAFFLRGSDENLIVLPLANADPRGMEVIFHEYTHLLFRHNSQIWPVWLQEGIAEVYSTFLAAGNQVEIARPIERHLETLANEPLMPLHELFAVTHDSPQYNEASRQGMFYAESWLLTDYLMAGDNPILKARFGRYTELLKQGETAEEAFTNALGVSLPAMENELRRYAKAGHYTPIVLELPKNVSAAVTVASYRVTPVEVLYRFGDELLRIGRLDDSQSYFERARKLAPASPLPYEGLGLLAAERKDAPQAISELQQALRLGSTSFLAHFVYAQEKYRLTSDGHGGYERLPDDQAAEIREELEKSIALMPDFAPAHELLGFFEMVQGDGLAAAEQQMDEAIELAPENPSYLFTLAEAQLRDREPEAARKTLAPLLFPNADARLHSAALELIQEMNGSGR